MHPSSPPSSSRSTFLTVILTLLVGGGICFFAFLLLGPLFVQGVSIVLALSLLAGLHYLLWGRSLNQEVAGEREEEQARAAALAREEAAAAPREFTWQRNGPNGPRGI